MSTALQLAALVAALAIIVCAEPAINRMTRATCMPMRVAYVLLAVGASGEVLALLAGDMPAVPQLIIDIGIVTMLVFNRRKCWGERRNA